MDSPRNGDGQRELDLEVERHREGGISAMRQLEWVVGYLFRIGKPQIARALDRNRKPILERIQAGDA